jgi:hypothetical protein
VTLEVIGFLDMLCRSTGESNGLDTVDYYFVELLLALNEIM